MTLTNAPASETGERLAAARVEGLSKVYGSGETRVVALDDVTLDLYAGEFTAIMGKSGSGKSTLMHCAAGLDDATSGHVFLGDVDLTTLKERHLTELRRDRIGFVFQAFNLVPTLTARGEHRAARGHRGAPPRPGVVRRGHRHRRPARPARATGRASSRAASSSGWRAPGPSWAAPTWSSPTSPPATSTRRRVPRCSASCAGWSTPTGRPWSW